MTEKKSNKKFEVLDLHELALAYGKKNEEQGTPNPGEPNHDFFIEGIW